MTVRVPSADEYACRSTRNSAGCRCSHRNCPSRSRSRSAVANRARRCPRPWSVYRWIEGEPLHSDNILDTVALADDLAGFLGALYACTPVGPSPGAHSFQRGGPVTVWNDHVETNLRALRDEVDVAAAQEVWTAALAAATRCHRSGCTATSPARTCSFATAGWRR